MIAFDSGIKEDKIFDIAVRYLSDIPNHEYVARKFARSIALTDYTGAFEQLSALRKNPNVFNLQIFLELADTGLLPEDTRWPLFRMNYRMAFMPHYFLGEKIYRFLSGMKADRGVLFATDEEEKYYYSLNNTISVYRGIDLLFGKIGRKSHKHLAWSLDPGAARYFAVVPSEERLSLLREYYPERYAELKNEGLIRYPTVLSMIAGKNEILAVIRENDNFTLLISPRELQNISMTFPQFREKQNGHIIQ
jgi:hypothetical protein